MITALALVLAMAAADPAPAPGGPDDPLAEARAGRIECDSPDMARKLCRYMITYSFGPDGQISAREEIVIAPGRPITAVITTPRVMKGAQVCNTPRLADIEAAEVFADYAPANAEVTKVIRDTLTSLVKLHDRELCRVYAHKGKGLTVDRQFDGVDSPYYRPEPMIWVDPADGWKPGS